MNLLVERARNGDEDAFTELILHFKNDLYKIAKTRLTNEEDIQDAIQDTMITAYKSIRKLKDTEKFKMWIIKILINKCNKIYRKKYKNDLSLEEYDLDKYLIMNSSKNIEDDLNFYFLIKNLEYQERIIVILYYMEKYTTKEISKILKAKENTVKSKLYRARIKLKKIFLRGEKNESIR